MKYNYTQPANELQRFADMVEFPDAEPTENSAQLVTSGGVYDAIQAVEEEAKQLSYNSLMEDTASGSIASFPDGAEGVPVKELTADIEPIQDLHGQASPYPPNGGKNMLPLTVANLKALNQSGTWSGNAYAWRGVTFTILTDSDNNVTGINVNGTATGGAANLTLVSAWGIASGTSYRMSGCPVGGSTSTYAIAYANEDGSYVGANYDTGTSSVISDGFSIVVITVTTGVSMSNKVFYPMVCLNSATDPTVFAPYSNICPISGYTGAEIPVANKNLVLSSVANCGVDNTGTVYTTQSYKLFVAPVKEGETYTITTSDNTAVVYAFFNSVPTIGSISYNGSRVVYYSSQTTATLTAPMTGYIAFRSDSNFVNAQLELGSSVTQYEAPSTTIYSVSWSDEAGTVYGGHFVVNEDGSVDLTVTNAKTTFVGASGENWNVQTIGDLINFYITINGSKTNTYGDNVRGNMFVGSPTAAASVGGLYISNHILNAGIGSIIGCSTVAELKTWLASNNLEVWYMLESPQTYHLDSIGQITTLLGDNNIWSDTGDISVKYRCNTALYIEKKLG